MCTALVRFDPTDEWPFLVAFVRDEDRRRTADSPRAWWPEAPSVLGGRDQRAGGTWLAVETAHPSSVAFLLNRLEPGLQPPMEGGHPTRGSVPLRAAAAGANFDLATDVEELERMAPFHLVTLSCLGVERQRREWWRWDGVALATEPIEPGVTVVGSRGLALDGEPARRTGLGDRFAAAAQPSLVGDSMAAWDEWVELLDGRDAQPDDLGSLVVHSVAERPGFGTVGASLVALAADGRVRYDVNGTQDVDPSAWVQVDTSSAIVPT